MQFALLDDSPMFRQQVRFFPFGICKFAPFFVDFGEIEKEWEFRFGFMDSGFFFGETNIEFGGKC